VDIREDVWLGRVFGHAVFKLEGLPREPGIGWTAARRALGEHIGQQARAMYYAKLDTADVQAARHVAAAGAYVVDVNVMLARRPRPPVTVAAPAGCAVREFRPEDSGDVLDVATTCFQYSRFHLDPLVPAPVANRIKHDWILNYIRGQRGDRLFVALAEGRPVGFLAALVSDGGDQRVSTIDLVGVGKPFQGRGLGAALVAAFVEHYRSSCELLQVGTQAANIPSMRLYEKLGFEMARTQYVMHLHVQDRRVREP